MLGLKDITLLESAFWDQSIPSRSHWQVLTKKWPAYSVLVCKPFEVLNTLSHYRTTQCRAVLSQELLWTVWWTYQWLPFFSMFELWTVSSYRKDTDIFIMWIRDLNISSYRTPSRWDRRQLDADFLAFSTVCQKDPGVVSRFYVFHMRKPILCRWGKYAVNLRSNRKALQQPTGLCPIKNYKAGSWDSSLDKGSWRQT